VGHMNIGAGRIVYQDLAKINVAVKNDTLKNEAVLKDAFRYAKQHNKKIHLLGLLSNGGVHAHIDHLKALLRAANGANVKNLYLHAFTDGRDVDPKTGAGFVEEIEKHMRQTTGSLATVVGRYYAMDRDRRWERIKKAYDLLCHGKGDTTTDVPKKIREGYKNGTTDEFIGPIVKTENGKPVATLQPQDVVLFFNFRTDRGRELTEVLTQKDRPEFGMKALPLYYVTLTNYDASFKNIRVVYKKDNLENTLGETISKAGKKQLRIAETEKYPHVTFFLNGGRETAFKGESRILCPSPKVATYDLKPEMSAFSIRDKIIPELRAKSADFICLNFANPDMVGHTGVFDAAVKACETVDSCSAAVVETALKNGYTTVIIADHGNSETMCNPDGSPHTAHTTNPVPLIIVDADTDHCDDGILADIAPTILKLMNIKQPTAMTGKPLI
ncbi:MAG: 2,3-bisphosphoglycerate-independent phosphoglycerate mutase, partial [Marinirhabdus sp.]